MFFCEKASDSIFFVYSNNHVTVASISWYNYCFNDWGYYLIDSNLCEYLYLGMPKRMICDIESPRFKLSIRQLVSERIDSFRKNLILW